MQLFKSIPKIRGISLRVHGDKKIYRRDGILELERYQDAKEILEEDFQYMCGYCGKNGKVMHQKFHIDHFVPKSLDRGHENDYYNLVLACPKCNLSKSNKWPTQDPKSPNNGEVGFVDPATEEFDNNIERNDEGYVVGLTTVGESMCKMLHLDIRRTDLYWKISKMREVQAKLEYLYQQGKLEEQEKNFYIETNIILKTYIDEAFLKGE